MGTGTVYSNIDTRGFDSPYGTLTLTQTEDHSEEKNDLYISQDDTTPRTIGLRGITILRMHIWYWEELKIRKNVPGDISVLPIDKRFSGPNVFDKVLYRGGLVARASTRIGVGVVMEGEEIRLSMRARGMELWATNHYGLMTDLEVIEVVEVKRIEEGLNS
ncbi:hypothetical protein H112_02414 [Trichophyton rubrum D6]|nr:hypothetical protein H102_02412 [Trichophyton rubrum CBS 100081]EZF54923.1 hypothetical protein H103_02424 [Trichophyton rubrum CBS 288.86]EZF65556.1 hypothetical protein H104_02399 [Trichophyton rubrum CBS 289.86]EZF86833.1 hypothetical protein H110_02418 [Trichophyton rubrum MR1448]EZF97624.1 hypothetical protein H113_02428 [Trichophyton rubrum MR1459]KDB36049.1 hypothetical protein H112_02414 [Trichophyton rubrum D6]KMQ43553.1 hypothetical protein HL42_5735 [Trichophyton rubrum]